MIEEAYVSFETAKLLKEKGFDEYCYKFYDYDSEKIYAEEPFCCNSRSDDYAAPTQQMAIRWLREVHHIILVFKPGAFSGEDCTHWTYEIWAVNKSSYLYYYYL